MRIPERLRPLAQWVVVSMPVPIAERVLPWKRAEFRAAGTARTGAAERRLLIGPVNSAGQAHAWAHAASAVDGVAAVNVMFRNAEDPFAYPADQSVPTPYAVRNLRWQRAQRRAIHRGFTHVLVESGRRLASEVVTSVRTEIEAFQRRGVRVGLLWHGSDIRQPSVHATMDPDSPFRDGAYADQTLLEEITLRNRELIAATDAPNFVSTPDLLAFVPDATWLPVVVDARRWAKAATGPVLERERPIVVHAPSRAGLKGTALVEPTLRRLHDEGLIEYREVVQVPSAQMPEVYGAADIVLDQFSLGIYGVAACEALAAGRVVVSHVSDVVREIVRAETGHDLPVIEARAADLEKVLRRVVSDRAWAAGIAAQGPSFVADVHDGTRSREALSAFLGG